MTPRSKIAIILMAAAFWSCSGTDGGDADNGDPLPDMVETADPAGEETLPDAPDEDDSDVSGEDIADVAVDETVETCPGFPPPPQSGGTTFHVSSTGSDENPGTEDQPLATIQEAADRVSAGDTVIVEDGTYAGPDGGPIVRISTGGAETSWIWFKARHVWGARLDGRDNTSTDGFAFGSGVSYVRIEGFEIFGMGNGSGSSSGIEVFAGGSHVEILKNHLHHIGRLCTDTTNGQVGVFVQQPHVTVEGNLFHDIGRHALDEEGCAVSSGYETHDHGIYVNGDPPGASFAVVRNNVFHHMARGWSVQVYPGTLEGISILNNTFALENPWRSGHIIIYDVTLSGSNIVNNVFYQPADSAISLGGSLDFTDVLVSHNLTTADAMTDAAVPAGMTVIDNILGTDPLLRDPAAGDFRLETASPAVDAGAALGEVELDYEGCTRPAGSGHDVGAYENR